MKRNGAPADMKGVLIRERGFREEALETVSASLGSSGSEQPRLRLPSEALEASSSECCSEVLREREREEKS